MLVNCKIDGCNEQAYMKIRWAGLSRHVQSANFCKEHSQKLWEKMNPLLRAGIGHWTNLPPDEEEAR